MGTPITGIRLAKPGKLKSTKHVVRGVVGSANLHHGGKHVSLEIKHGPMPKPKKPKKGELGMSSMYDDRPSSNFTLPSHVAKAYPVGTPVHIGITPVGPKNADLPNDGDEDDGE